MDKPAKVVFSEADDMGAPLGMLVLSYGEGVHGKPLLGGLLVDKDHRRTGIASRLVRRAEQHALENGEPRIFAVTHPSNRATRELMKSLGYTEMILLDKKLG